MADCPSAGNARQTWRGLGQKRKAKEKAESAENCPFCVLYISEALLSFTLCIFVVIFRWGLLKEINIKQ